MFGLSERSKQMTNAAKNTAELVQAGVLALQQAGWTEARIIAQLPYLATEAVKFLAERR
jgi:hypothetical protein